MNHGRISRNGKSVLPTVTRTNRYIERLCGLLFRTPLSTDEGLLITPCSSVHTFGMRYNIDLVFLDKTMKIMKVIHSLAPWRMAMCRGATSVLELTANCANNLQLEEGQQLTWHDDDNP